jgi:hypothetical protein
LLRFMRSLERDSIDSWHNEPGRTLATSVDLSGERVPAEADTMWIVRRLRARKGVTRSALAPRPNPQDELFELMRKAAVWLPFY